MREQITVSIAGMSNESRTVLREWPDDSKRPMTSGGRPADFCCCYVRELPGGGRVRVEVARTENAGDCRGRVVLERRDQEDDRPASEAPPIVAEHRGTSEDEVFGELFRVAADNAAIARALLQRRRPP